MATEAEEKVRALIKKLEQAGEITVAGYLEWNMFDHSEMFLDGGTISNIDIYISPPTRFFKTDIDKLFEKAIKCFNGISGIRIQKSYPKGYCSCDINRYRYVECYIKEEVGNISRAVTTILKPGIEAEGYIGGKKEKITESVLFRHIIIRFYPNEGTAAAAYEDECRRRNDPDF